jgi:heat-inducible transcriptional repressor
MALVSTTYGGAEGGSALGTLGPTRMDYPGTIAAVAAVARYVGRLLNED